MTQQAFFKAYSVKAYSATAAENYERYFVPSIAAPLVENLLELATLRPGERVLDVACGTGAVTRLARQRVGDGGLVAGLDVNPGMLASGGRVVVSVPGPTPPLFDAMADALGKHIGTQAAAFVQVVFSLHDEPELRELMKGAGFRDVDVQKTRTTVALPPAGEFLWQYVFSTPLANLVAKASDEARGALEEELGEKWRKFTVGRTLRFEVPMTTVIGR